MDEVIELLTLTRQQVREVDRIAIEEYGIPGVVLMENAGRNAAQILLTLPEILHGAAIVCGSGNNGGDGFVIARHLANSGAAVEVFLACDPTRLTEDALTNYVIVERMRLPLVRFNTPEAILSGTDRLHAAGIVVDALLGTGFTGDVRPPLDRVIAAMNDAPGRVIAIDVPSGLDCDSGLATNATVRADDTITFVAMKQGFSIAMAAEYTGQVHLVDIGAPPEIIEAVRKRR